MEWCGDEDPGVEWPCTELLRAASWRAARSGLSGDLIDPQDGTVRPAREAIGDLLDRLRPYLDDRGEYSEVAMLCDGVFTQGNGSSRQRQAFNLRRSTRDVIDLLRLSP